VRSEAARQAILEATARQFGLRGYDRLTIEGVAADAGVGKQTIYRWWATKGSLVAECLLEGMLFPRQFWPPNTGDLREDLADWLAAVFATLDDPTYEQVMRSAVAAAAEHAEVGRRLWDSLGGAASLDGRLEAAIADGELAAGAPISEIADALVGALILRALGGVTHQYRATAGRLVATVLAGHWAAPPMGQPGPASPPEPD
jgi:AcrR family transcriptional regulator